MTYSDRLKDPRWQRRRLEAMQAANFSCEDCGRRDQELQIHHTAYIRDANPWEYGAEHIMCVCSVCHQTRQKFEDTFRLALGETTRFLKPAQLEAEVWTILRDVRFRETQRLAEAFTP